ncbi:MAG: carbohydrate-binding domain-containing protein [Lachnospiraceae bacterium]|nr:carbohydrate-binding domain-containing protein [Lachnospiraceae bacterium]
MKKKQLFHRFSKTVAIAILTVALLLCGCTSTQDATTESVVTASESTSVSAVQTVASVDAANTALVSSLDTSDMFSDRDQKTDYDESECILITLNGDSASCDGKGVTVEVGTVIIKEAGNYILRGSFNGSIRVETAEDAKVWLILDGVTITSNGTAAIYAKTADKVFVTTAKDSKNTITNTGDFAAIDENNIDGAIYSKCDLTLNGNGTLVVSSEKGHGIVSKDDLKITSGTYEITAGDHGISGKDSIRILDGSITITSTEDGLHSGNDEDADKGYVYIANGNIKINAGDDAIHGESRVVIANGTIDVAKCTEGIEAAIVEIAGGDVNVVASDDGINATDGSGTEGFGGGRGGFGQAGSKDATSSSVNTNVYIMISGGKVTVDAQGDGIDSNGALYVSGGEVYVNGPENSGNGALDYDSKAEITGGTLIAIGSSGMAMNFSSSTQGSALVTFSESHAAGETVQLKDSKGNVIVSFVSARKFSTVVVSSPLMKQGETYTLTSGSESKEFTLDQLLYGNGSGGFGGFGGQGGQMPGGQMPGGQMPGGKGGFDSQKPEGFDGQLPEGFDKNFEGGMPNFPGGSDGERQRPSRPEGKSSDET